ncbi:MAG: carboxynorspermidine decarboxylase [Oscillospiraceae bacterium]|nr:carboxynorspermidine decarboxylase [Oscillospiraceae bacterium]
MRQESWINKVRTPCYVIDEKRLRENLEILKSVKERSGCKILLAQKAYSVFQTYPLIAEYLDGCTASGLYEARLGHEEMAKPFGRENHVFSPAYLDEEFDEIAKICGHISFNNIRQFEKFKDKAKNASCGIRINPEHSTQEHAIYDPCGEYSRLGTTLANFPDLPEGVEGLHFHTLCEQNADALAETMAEVVKKFGKYLGRIKWLNMGGGHHITRPDYDIDLLVETIRFWKYDTYGFEVYLEPGEAIALNAGYLVTTVLDTFTNGMDIAITDASAACHMPDVLEMPYRPNIRGAGEKGEKPFTYRLGGNTCLAGDVIGDYSFENRLSEGDRLVFEDMAIYSMCKNNTFNGMALPSIYLLKDNGETELIRRFGYEDFKERL